MKTEVKHEQLGDEHEDRGSVKCYKVRAQLSVMGYKVLAPSTTCGHVLKAKVLKANEMLSTLRWQVCEGKLTVRGARDPPPPFEKPGERAFGRAQRLPYSSVRV
jgi:hypothetical protein